MERCCLLGRLWACHQKLFIHTPYLMRLIGRKSKWKRSVKTNWKRKKIYWKFLFKNERNVTSGNDYKTCFSPSWTLHQRYFIIFTFFVAFLNLKKVPFETSNFFVIQSLNLYFPHLNLSQKIRCRKFKTRFKA